MKSNNSTGSGKKKILLISYHFPPSTAVGGLRSANFAKHLPLFGWNTYVLTIKDHNHKKVDTRRLKDIGEVKIFKAGRLPTIIQAYLRLKTIYHSLINKRYVTLEELEKSYPRQYGNLSGSENIFQKFKRYLVSFLTLPDTERNWVLPAVFKAVWEIKREKIDCILTSSPPCSVHLIGLLVKIITGVKWVADFRDPWITTGPKRVGINCALSIRVEEWLEQKVVQKADLVLLSTEKLCGNFQKSYKKQPLNKFLYITNGFDMEIASKIGHLNKYEKFTLTYTGSLYIGRSPEPVFKAVKELALEGKLNLEDIRVKLVGNCQYVDDYPIDQIVHSYGLGSAVEVLEPVPYSDALEMIKQSHLALLFAPNQPFQIPAKVYDYMGLGTKVLALTEEGATWDLINSTGAGAVFYPSDIEGIKEFIFRSISNGESLLPENNSDILHKFDRKLITENLANHLNSI